MKKICLTLFTAVCALVLTGCSETDMNKELIGMPNPWTDCGTNSAQAAKYAGFAFSPAFKNLSIRAMKDMIEITYPIDSEREVTVRKAAETNQLTDEHGIADISGDYNSYPINESMQLYDSVWINVRRDTDKIYVVNFSAETGLYSIDCPKGLTLDEVKSIFKIIEKAETANLPY